jgi:ribose transport system substrate-binding protein
MSNKENNAIHKPEIHEPEAATYRAPKGLDSSLGSLPLVQTDSSSPRQIGYLVNYSFHIWYQILMEIIARRSSQYGASVVIRDAHLNVENQVQQARELMSEVDALILTPAADQGLEVILKEAADRGIPVLVEANPIAGMKTLVAICDYDAGYKLGRWVGENITAPSGEVLRVLDAGLPTLRPCLLRSEGFIKGLQNVQPNTEIVARINGQANQHVAKDEAASVLSKHPDVNVIFSMDDETAEGAFEAYKDANLDPSRLTIAAFGLAGDRDKETLASQGALKVSAAMFPEYVAVRCVDGLMRLATGAQVKRRDITPTIPMTSQLLPRYYPKKDGDWTPDLQAIAALPVEAECSQE